MAKKNVEKKRFKVPHTYVILFGFILVVALLTYIIPAGDFEMITDEVTGKGAIDPNSFHYVDQNPTNLFGLFSSVFRGLNDAAPIVFFIFIVGGAFQIITATGTIEAGIGKIALGLSRSNTLTKLTIFIIVTLFAAGGATFGMAEEVIIFIPIGIALARSVGYDAMTGSAMVILGAACGFTSGVMNPFTVGVAQSIAELPLFSGVAFRLIIIAAMILITTWYIMRYGEKVKKDPSKSIVRELEEAEKDKRIHLSNIPTLTVRHNLVLLTLVGGLGIIVYGVFKSGWYISEIATTFLAIGIIGGLLGGFSPSRIAEEFVEGAKGIVFGALVVGIARGVLVIMQDGKIINTIVFGLANMIQALPKSISVLGMYLVQIIVNFFIPSGSGQAAATMPIMVPLADLLNVNRQIAVTAYQFGDGFTNSIIPTGAIFAYLSIAKISYEKWVKFFWPLLLIWFGMGAIFLLIANAINYGPF